LAKKEVVVVAEVMAEDVLWGGGDDCGCDGNGDDGCGCDGADKEEGDKLHK
jgi:hypothetical protein